MPKVQVCLANTSCGAKAVPGLREEAMIKSKKAANLALEYPSYIIREYNLMRFRAACALNREVNYQRMHSAYCGLFLCADCGAPARHYDHRDYFEPFQITPVCHTCNVRRGPARKTLNRLVSGERQAVGRGKNIKPLGAKYRKSAAHRKRQKGKG